MALSRTTSGLLFRDRFDDRRTELGVDLFDTNSLANYTASHDTAATWAIADGKLSATGGLQSLQLRTGVSFADGYCETVSSHADDAGLILRFQDNSNYYLCAIRDDSSASAARNVEIFKRQGGTFTGLVFVDVPWARGTEKRVRFEALGDRLYVYIDGVAVIDHKDTTFAAAGLCGMRIGGSTANYNYFNEFRWGTTTGLGANYALSTGGGDWYLLGEFVRYRAAGAGGNAKLLRLDGVNPPGDEVVFQMTVDRRTSTTDAHAGMYAERDTAGDRGALSWIGAILDSKHDAGSHTVVAGASNNLPTPLVPRVEKTHIEPGRVRAWFGDALTTYTGTLFDAILGKPQIRTTDKAGAAWDFFDLIVCTGNALQVMNLPAGYSARVKQGSTVASAVESGGIATIDLAGMSLPVAGFEVLDGSGTVVDLIAGDVFGGDVYSYAAGSAGSLLKQTDGFVFFDDFNRADGAVGNGWDLLSGSWSIATNRLRHYWNGTFGRALIPGAHTNIGEAVVQAKIQTDGGTIYGGTVARHLADNNNGYRLDVGGTADAGATYRLHSIRRLNGAETTLAYKDGATHNVQRQYKHSVEDGRQRLWKDGKLDVVTTDATLDGVLGTVGAYGQGASGYTGNMYFDDFGVCRGNWIRASGLQAGQVLRAAGKTATEVGGVAEIDMGEVLFPLSGIDVVNSDGTVAATYVGDVWGGTEFLSGHPGGTTSAITLEDPVRIGITEPPSGGPWTEMRVEIREEHSGDRRLVFDSGWIAAAAEVTLAPGQYAPGWVNSAAVRHRQADGVESMLGAATNFNPKWASPRTTPHDVGRRTLAEMDPATYPDATIALEGTSIAKRPDALSLDYLTAFTPGPLAVGDNSGGAFVRVWRVDFDPATNDIRIARENDAGTGYDAATTLFNTGGAVVEIDAAFDQNARIVVVCQRTNATSGTPEIWIYYHSSTAGAYVFENFGSGRTPRCALDSPTNADLSDVLVFYADDNASRIRYRQQRDRYATAYDTPIVASANYYLEDVIRTTKYRLRLLGSVRDPINGTWKLSALETGLYPVPTLADGLNSVAPSFVAAELDKVLILVHPEPDTSGDAMSTPESVNSVAPAMQGAELDTVVLVEDQTADAASMNSVVPSFVSATLEQLFQYVDVDQTAFPASVDSVIPTMIAAELTGDFAWLLVDMTPHPETLNSGASFVAGTLETA